MPMLSCSLLVFEFWAGGERGGGMEGMWGGALALCASLRAKEQVREAMK